MVVLNRKNVSLKSNYAEDQVIEMVTPHLLISYFSLELFSYVNFYQEKG